MDWVTWCDYGPDGAFSSVPEELYTAWIAWNPSFLPPGEDGKFERMYPISAGIRADFRQAAAADADPVAAADTDLVPESCLRHCNAMYRYLFAIEIGFAGAENYRAAWQDAEVYLRGLYVRMRASGAGAAAASPTYAAPRRVSGDGSASSSDMSAGATYGGDGGTINFGRPPIV